MFQAAAMLCAGRQRMDVGRCRSSCPALVRSFIGISREERGEPGSRTAFQAATADWRTPYGQLVDRGKARFVGQLPETGPVRSSGAKEYTGEVIERYLQTFGVFCSQAAAHGGLQGGPQVTLGLCGPLPNSLVTLVDSTELGRVDT